MSLKDLYFRTLVAAFALSVAPISTRADCVPSAPAGWVIPYTMTTHTNQGNNKDLVSYTTGSLTAYRQYFGTHLSSDNNLQLFSNQFSNCGIPGFSSQPFDVTKPNYIGVDILENFQVWPATIGVTLTLDSWGYGKSSFVGHCDAGSNLLYGTVDNSAMVLISFDAPQPPPVVK